VFSLLKSSDLGRNNHKDLTFFCQI
jgi:hypothetical protein